MLHVRQSLCNNSKFIKVSLEREAIPLDEYLEGSHGQRESRVEKQLSHHVRRKGVAYRATATTAWLFPHVAILLHPLQVPLLEAIWIISI